MDTDKLTTELAEVVAPLGLELDALEVAAAGKRSVLRVYLDGDGPKGTGPTMDEIAEATRAISRALDDSPAVGDQPYTLEVSSRGTSRPLDKPAHFRRNRKRLVKITLADGETLTGRIMAADENTVTLVVDGAERVLAYADITKALVQIEMNKSSDLEDADDDSDDDADEE